MVRVAILDDEEEVFGLLAYILRREGHHVRIFPEAESVHTKLRRFLPQVIIVAARFDVETWGLKKKVGALAGVRILALQTEHRGSPALAKRADACLQRPLDAAAVISAVKALSSRKSTGGSPSEIVVDKLIIKPFSGRVTRSGKVVPLNTFQFRVLNYLASRPNLVCRRDRILEEVGDNGRVTAGMIDVCVRQLRRKIEISPKTPIHIKSVKGQGYVFCRTVEARW